MNGLSLALYGLVNGAMVLCYLIQRNRIFEFPFWAGMIALGWFFPMAIGGLSSEQFPEGAYFSGMFFASICTLAMWGGYEMAVLKKERKRSLLDMQFDLSRLYWAGAVLCLAGFFFEWKLSTLPEEMLKATQWSGAAVKYHFLASVFKFGFISLWLLYLSQNRKSDPRLLVLLIPCLLLLLEAAVIRGRRAEMMNLAAYLLICPWFVRRRSLPRWMLVGGLLLGLLLINSIGLYRGIMREKDVPLGERIKIAMQADYAEESKDKIQSSGREFENYIFYRYIYAKQGNFDFGLKHWNGLIFNYVPAQLVGRTIKNALMIPFNDNTLMIAHREYGHSFGVGTTLTGYTDAFASFGWLGFIKFYIIGWIMGMLYRRAMTGYFLGQLLYVYALGSAMRGVTHGTHAILLSIWIYFFVLGFPAFYWAKAK